MFLLNELRKRFEFTKLCYVLKFKILKFVATTVLIIFCVHGVLLSKLEVQWVACTRLCKRIAIAFWILQFAI